MDVNGCCNSWIGTKEAMMNTRRLKELAIKSGAYEELLRKQFMEEKEMASKITLIGSMRNKEAMMEIYNKLTLRGEFVMLPYMSIMPEDTDEETIERLNEIHHNKLRMSDLVIVVDQDGYIGKDTRAEIKWCEGHQIRIIYASDLAMLDNTQPAKSKK